MIPTVRRSGLTAPRAGGFPRLGVLAALIVVMLATLGPAAVLAADPSPAPVRQGPATVIPERAPERAVAANPVPMGSVGVLSSIGYFYGDNSVAVVGEVQNKALQRRRSIRIEVTYYNATDQRLGEFEDNVVLDRVARGSLGPFLLFDASPPGPVCPASAPPPNCIKNYRIRVVSSVGLTTPPAGVLRILDSTSSVVGDVRRFQGTIQNPNSFPVATSTVAVTAYGADGDVIDVTHGLPIGGGWLRSGESAPYRLDIAVSPNPELAFHHAGILADGYRSGSTSAYVTSWANYFDDIATDPFRANIIWLAEAGITGGCGAGRYCPTASVQRDQMASFLSRAIGLTGTAPDVFIDDEGNTHEPSINRLAAAQITGGCAPQRYCPSAVVRRDAMASFLSRALDLPPTTTDYFTDDNSNSHEKNINRLRAAGITGGCGGTKYCPTAVVTRSQMAAFLRRAFSE